MTPCSTVRPTLSRFVPCSRVDGRADRMTPTIVSAADARYGKWLINLVGSVQRKSRLSPKIALYDLGLPPFQRRLLDGAEGVDVLEVPPFVPHWRRGRTWKTWI